MDYNTVKTTISQIEGTIKALENQIPIYQQRDKCGLSFAGFEDYNTPKIGSDGHWGQATIRFGASHGYYGNSSAYDDMSPMLAEYVLKALRRSERSIIESAIAIAKEERRELAQKIKEESEKILALAVGYEE